MSALNDQVRENMQRLSDQALIKVIETDFRDYTEEAIAFAKEELARRGRIAAVKATASKVDDTVARTAGDAKAKGFRFWGGFFLVLAALITYTAVLVISTIALAKQYGMRPKSEAVPTVIFYAVLIALGLWAGIKRRPRWQGFLGITFLIIGGLAFVSRFSLVRVSARSPLMMKAILITSIVLIVLGAACGLLALVRRRSEA